MWILGLKGLTRSYILSEMQARVFFFFLTLFSLSKYHKGYFSLVGFDTLH